MTDDGEVESKSTAAGLKTGATRARTEDNDAGPAKFERDASFAPEALRASGQVSGTKAEGKSTAAGLKTRATEAKPGGPRGDAAPPFRAGATPLHGAAENQARSKLMLRASRARGFPRRPVKPKAKSIRLPGSGTESCRHRRRCRRARLEIRRSFPGRV